MPRPGVGSPSSPSVLLLAKDCTPWTYGPSGPGEVGSRYRHPPQRLASGRAATRRNNLRQFSQTNVMACASRRKSTSPQPSMTPPSSPRRTGSSWPSHPLRGSILATFLLLLLLEDLRHVARCRGPRPMACGRIFLLAAIGSGKREGSGSDHFRAQDALLTSKSWPPPAGRRPSSPSSSSSSATQKTRLQAEHLSFGWEQIDLDLQLVSVWASTSRDRPRRSSRPARHRAGRTGAGAGHGATHGGAPVAPDLRVSRGERRRQVEFRVPIDVGAGRPWLGGLRRWLPGFVAVGLPAARHPPPGPGFSPIE